VYLAAEPGAEEEMKVFFNRLRRSEKFDGRDSETVYVVMRVAPYSDIT
jgi:hypothetical protein